MPRHAPSIKNDPITPSRTMDAYTHSISPNRSTTTTWMRTRHRIEGEKQALLELYMLLDDRITLLSWGEPSEEGDGIRKVLAGLYGKVEGWLKSMERAA
ncbi:MAG: hypothetical protein Q9166_006468 [cf. Caloplaca sp. 2 TL-2023]